MSRQKQDNKVRIRFDRVPNENTKFLDIDRSYIEKGIVEINEEDNEAALTELGELYGIAIGKAEHEPFDQDIAVGRKLTDYGYDWVMVYFSEHKPNIALINVILKVSA